MPLCALPVHEFPETAEYASGPLCFDLLVCICILRNHGLLIIAKKLLLHCTRFQCRRIGFRPVNKRQAEGLGSDQGAVDTRFIRDETLMRPLLNGSPILKHNDMVRLLDSREAVGDGDCCAVPRDLIEGSLDHILALDIDCTGSFVEDNNSWLLDDAPCYGDSLFLAS